MDPIITTQSTIQFGGRLQHYPQVNICSIISKSINGGRKDPDNRRILTENFQLLMRSNWLKMILKVVGFIYRQQHSLRAKSYNGTNFKSIHHQYPWNTMHLKTKIFKRELGYFIFAETSPDFRRW